MTPSVPTCEEKMSKEKNNNNFLRKSREEKT